VREAALWISGAALAFLLTAGAFLLLANLGTGPSEKSLGPGPRSGGSEGPDLELGLDEGQLAALEALPNQNLDLVVKNGGQRALSDVNLTLEVSSENTALTDASYYRRTLQEIDGGQAVKVDFVLDLSPPAQTVPGQPEPPRTLLEIRATTPDGVSAVRTVILPL
jgi:hypothetical protein